eukprot:scaffold5453_cov58-Attheya_sp.AAC.7
MILSESRVDNFSSGCTFEGYGHACRKRASTTQQIQYNCTSMPGIPICIHDPSLGMFRVTHSKGKCFSSGGFGIAVKGSCSNNDDVVDEENEDTATAQHLFMEEVVFLHERGLIEAFASSSSTDGSPMGDAPLNSMALFAMLTSTESKEGMPLAAYLTYAHLRSQTFIVIRHTPQRLGLVKRIHEICTSTVPVVPVDASVHKRGQGIRQLQRSLRSDAQNASVPAVWESCSHDTDQLLINVPRKRQRGQACLEKSTTGTTSDSIAFHVYRPNTNFRKTKPGIPDFCVAITPFAQKSPPFEDLLNLVKACEGIPLRLATVADGGTVILFGVTDGMVPNVSTTNHKKCNDMHVS